MIRPTTGPTCCAEECGQRGSLHLFAGVIDDGGKVREQAGYTGGTYCSWEHLAMDVERVLREYGREPDYMDVPVKAAGQGDHGSD